LWQCVVLKGVKLGSVSVVLNRPLLPNAALKNTFLRAEVPAAKDKQIQESPRPDVLAVRRSKSIQRMRAVTGHDFVEFSLVSV
jgi:hypothetical protein